MDFFNKISDTISSTSKDVAQKAKNLTEITKLNSEIKNADKKINDAMLAIGYAYYTKFSTEENCDYKDFILIINKNKEQVQSLQRQISNIKRLNVCKNCGASIIKDSKFCASCGAKFETEDSDYVD
jgi:rRNA maturation endonuclease Nob1